MSHTRSSGSGEGVSLHRGPRWLVRCRYRPRPVRPGSWRCVRPRRPPSQHHARSLPEAVARLPFVLDFCCVGVAHGGDLSRQAMKYLSYLLYPLCIGGAVYSLLNIKYKR